MYYVYVIESVKDGKRYTGMTNDLERRLREHNAGHPGTVSTRGRGPFKLFYYEKVFDGLTAREREKFLKSGKGREFLEKFKIPE